MQASSRATKARVNGVELAYTDQGTGIPVILIHGYPLNRSMWDSQVAALARKRRVIAPDLRGHGNSGAPTGTYSMDLLADDIAGLLDHFKIDRAVLVGFSMGGYVAFAFYRKYPNRVRGLVLADTRPQPDSPEAAEGRENTAQAVLKDGVSGVAQALPARMAAPVTAQRKPELLKQISQLMESTPVNGYVGDLRGLASRPDSTPTLAKINCPTLIIVGEHDAITPVADSELMAKSIKGARLVKIRDAGHLSPLEQPEAFNRALEDFLTRV